MKNSSFGKILQWRLSKKINSSEGGEEIDFAQAQRNKVSSEYPSIPWSMRKLLTADFSLRESLVLHYVLTFLLGIVAYLITYSSRNWALAVVIWTGGVLYGLAACLNRPLTEAQSHFVQEVKRLIFGGGLDWSKETPGELDIKRILRADWVLFTWLITDLILINLGLYCGYLIRFNGVIDPVAFQPYVRLWYFLTVAHLGIFAFFKLYCHPRQFSRTEVVVRSVKAVTLSTLASVAIVYIYRQTAGAFPALVFAVAWFFNSILIGGWRIYIRYDNP
jgi:hypothetical protein